MTTHFHTKADELHVFIIPADTDQKPEMRVIPNRLAAMNNQVGGHIEVAPQRFMPHLDCGCTLAMVMNEEGSLRGLPVNTRAGFFYPGTIFGDVFIVAEGHTDPENPDDQDFFSLPQSFTQWEGPGDPLPSSKQPWEK